jgi:hypothetical protein
MTTLFRPVGLNELSLIWDSGMREFPPRLAHQPIFYPVANREYATQIARDWNTKESSFAGYVTKFSVPNSHLAPYEPHTVGSATHVEYWIPAKDLPQFNKAILGIIDVESGYFGEGFRGFIPDGFGLKGKDVVAQFVAMAKTWDYSRMDFVCEVATNRKAIYLNFLFWSQFDFNTLGIGHQLRDSTIDRLREAWDFNHIGVPLPVGPVLPNHD